MLRVRHEGQGIRRECRVPDPVGSPRWHRGVWPCGRSDRSRVVALTSCCQTDTGRSAVPPPWNAPTVPGPAHGIPAAVQRLDPAGSGHKVCMSSLAQVLQPWPSSYSVTPSPAAGWSHRGVGAVYAEHIFKVKALTRTCNI